MAIVDFVGPYSFDPLSTSNASNFLRIFSQAQRPYSIFSNTSQDWTVRFDFPFGGATFARFFPATTFLPGPSSQLSPPAGIVDAVGLYNSSGNLIALFEGLASLNISVSQLISNPSLLVSGSDSFRGSGGNDLFDAGAGDDVLDGGGGNDTLRGGEGWDIAIYGGIRSQYSISSGSGTTTVTGLGAAANLDGTDTVSGVEILAFLDDVNRVAWGDFVGVVGTDLLWTQSGSTVLQATSLLPGIVSEPAAVIPSLALSARIQGLGDITGEGAADAFVRNAADNSFRVLRLVEPGPPLTTTIGNPTYDWAVQGVFDTNGDGRSDVIWRRADGTLAIWQMASNGLVATSIDYGAPSNAFQIAGFGDINDDGSADIIWRSAGGDVVAWIMGSGNSYTARVLGATNQGWQIQAVNDVNGDRRADLIWQNASGATAVWLIYDSGFQAIDLGIFSHSQQIVFSADANSDGRADIIWRNVNSSVTISTMTGSGVAATTTLNLPQNWASNPVAPKVNRFFDFAPDRWFEVGFGQVTAARQVMRSMDPGGTADLAWRNVDGSVAIWGLGASGLTAGAVSGSAGLNWQIASSSGDFNGDGRSDILWRNGEGQVGFWFMNGLSVSSFAIGENVPHSFQIIGAADANGDGRSDIFWRNLEGQLVLWTMDGPNKLSSTSVVATGQGGSGSFDLGTRVDAIADLNGDGRADILWRGSDGSVRSWFLNGSTVSGTGSYGVVGLDWQIQAVGDLNADGRTDLIWRRSDGLVAAWLMDGSTVQSAATVTGAGQDWRIIGAGDMTGDGRADILWRNVETGTVLAWQMNGTALAGTVFVGGADPTWQVATTGRLFAS